MLLWDEFEAICALPNCGCDLFNDHVDHSNNLKLFQFIMGLDETYATIRSNLLMRKPLPSLNEAYNALNQEESQCEIVGLLTVNSNASVSSYTSCNSNYSFPTTVKGSKCNSYVLSSSSQSSSKWNPSMNDKRKGKKILQPCTFCHMRAL